MGVPVEEQTPATDYHAIASSTCATSRENLY